MLKECIKNECKRTAKSVLEGTRKKVKQRKRWRDVVEED
jgi:hypothetical protein